MEGKERLSSAVLGSVEVLIMSTTFRVGTAALAYWIRAETITYEINDHGLLWGGGPHVVISGMIRLLA